MMRMLVGMILLVFPLSACGGADEAADTSAADTPSAEAPAADTPENLQIDFDITKMISAEDATIDFTPEAQGPIAIACTMNMYRGTLLAE